MPEAPVVWRLATVRQLIDETPRARTLVLDVPEWPGHLAGQHVDVRLTAEDGSELSDPLPSTARASSSAVPQRSSSGLPSCSYSSVTPPAAIRTERFGPTG
jgi:hypothetical protein